MGIRLFANMLFRQDSFHSRKYIECCSQRIHAPLTAHRVIGSAHCKWSLVAPRTAGNPSDNYEGLDCLHTPREAVVVEAVDKLLQHTQKTENLHNNPQNSRKQLQRHCMAVALDSALYTSPSYTSSTVT